MPRLPAIASPTANIAAALPRIAAERGDSVAMRCPGRRGWNGLARYDAVLTWRELEARSNAIAVGLLALGLRRGARLAEDAGVALSINLTGGVFVNQSAAFSDFHGTGANPAANASYTDGAYVASRFRVIQSRRHV
mgnify:CR=1 FL=1